ncbi:relaxase/mobilization nuclease domain-containing protein [Ketobacter sp.]
MILKGSQRAGGRQMALHLLNGEQNEHVDVHQVRGFIADNVLGALNEAYALSKGTQCKQFMYSLYLNPPPDQNVDTDTFERTIDQIEERLGLTGQPRVVVFHEKEGRRHAHCVWSRIDIDQMKAINMSHDRQKLNRFSKSLYLEHGWKLPEGFKNKDKGNPLNFTRDQWQQAKRIGRNAADIKEELQECWAISDSKKGFENALKEHGYILAKGDKRSYVVIDHFGEIYSLPRQLGQKKKDLEARLGKAVKLQSVDEAKKELSKQLSSIYIKYRNDLDIHHKKEQVPLLTQKQELNAAHKKMRESLESYQNKRWQDEELNRASRVRHGFKGLWDKLSGRYWKVRKQNEQEAYACYLRDQKQKDELIQKQLAQRQQLQNLMLQLREKQEEERKNLIKDFSHIKIEETERHPDQTRATENDLSIDQNYDGPELEM